MTKKKLNKKQNSHDYSTFNKPVIVRPVKSAVNTSKSIVGIKGFINLGNTCYFNSMLQMLINSPCFLESLKGYCSSEQTIIAHLKDIEYKLVLKLTDVSNVEKELLSIWESDKTTISPSNLRTALLQHKDFKTHFNGFNEQDSHEVFLMVLNIIKEAQIKRVRGAVLDYFNCRRMTTVIDDTTKKSIKEVSAAVEKQVLVNNIFGIVVASNLKCQRCGELRMRFDEVLHIAPSFPAKCDFEKNDRVSVGNSHDVVVVDTVKNVSDDRQEKTSKHQMKRQKRIEKKAARNKKSIIRNIDCSEDVTVNEVQTITKDNEEDDPLEHVDESMPENLVAHLNEDTEMDYPIVVGGYSDGAEVEDNSLVTQQLIFDAVNRESLNKSRSKCSSLTSNDSMIARKNDSSHDVSLNSINSVDLEMFVEDEFSQLSVEDESAEKVVSTQDDDGDKFYTAENTLSLSTDQIEEDSDVDNVGPLIPKDSDEVEIDNNLSNHDVNGDSEMTQDDPVMFFEEPVRCDDKRWMQTVYSATLDTHQERLYNFSQGRQLFEQETDLDRALSRFNIPMYLENVVCENCSKSNEKIHTDHFKTDVICHLPQILPFYISRFKQTSARNRTKNTLVYSYPFVLNLSSQCSKYANFSDRSRPVLYRLFGIIEHIGARINTGHYVSYVCRARDETTPATGGPPSPYPSNVLSDISMKHTIEQYDQFQWQPDKDGLDAKDNDPSLYRWYRVSDSHIESVSNDVVKNIQAFMLFYSRIQ